MYTLYVLYLSYSVASFYSIYSILVCLLLQELFLFCIIYNFETPQRVNRFSLFIRPEAQWIVIALMNGQVTENGQPST